MSKHKGADQQRGKPSQQREQAAGQNRDPRKPNEGGAQDRGAQQDRQNSVGSKPQASPRSTATPSSPS